MKYIFSQNNFSFYLFKRSRTATTLFCNWSKDEETIVRQWRRQVLSVAGKKKNVSISDIITNIGGRFNNLKTMVNADWKNRFNTYSQSFSSVILKSCKKVQVYKFDSFELILDFLFLFSRMWKENCSPKTKKMLLSVFFHSTSFKSFLFLVIVFVIDRFNYNSSHFPSYLVSKRCQQTSWKYKKTLQIKQILDFFQFWCFLSTCIIVSLFISIFILFIFILKSIFKPIKVFEVLLIY